MPNWCQNRLHISGPKRDVSRFALENRGKPKCRLSFEKLLPTPDSLLVTKEQNRSIENVFSEMRGEAQPQDWYTWRIAKWGTKWDLSSDTLMSRTGNEITYEFDSAWSPPIAWLEEAAVRYPTLKMTLRYVECGANYSGMLSLKGEDVIDQTEGTASDVHPDDYFGEYF